MLSMDGSIPDPRSTQATFMRGSNTYMGASKSPYAGKLTGSSVDQMHSAALLPQSNKSSLAEVAKRFVQSGRV